MNAFVAYYDVKSAVGFRCGDGIQLGYFRFSDFLSADVATNCAGIYSSDFGAGTGVAHIRYHNIGDWVEAPRPALARLDIVRNPYPLVGSLAKRSFADAYFFLKHFDAEA